MGNDVAPTEAGRQYIAAQEAQYETKDLHEALDLYRALVAAHPNAQEAEYSRTQIRNIVKRVVPSKRLLDAQVELALDHLKDGAVPNVGSDPVMLLDPKPPN
jgi:hypothetical protein